MTTAQDTAYARTIINTLCSKEMYGRGYLNRGDEKAAEYISKQFTAVGLERFYQGQIQKFVFDVNTIPHLEIKTSTKTLIPGVDYLADAASPVVKEKYTIFYADSNFLKQRTFVDKLNDLQLIVIDTIGWDHSERFGEAVAVIKQSAKAVAEVQRKLTWRVSTVQQNSFYICLLKNALSQSDSTLDVNIQAKFKKRHVARNIIGVIDNKSDSFIVFTAHYDHLGGMGKNTYFPGANDNAGGIAMLLNLAQYYKKHKSKYNIVFIAFAAEEAGMLGSFYFVDNPWFELSKIKFLLNLDLVGTGEEGAVVVNATVYKEEFAQLEKINNKEHYLKKLKERGVAANSDHFPFYKKGVKCFFVYTMGGIAAYHDVYDRPETLPLTKFIELQKLLVTFVEALETKKD